MGSLHQYLHMGTDTFGLAGIGGGGGGGDVPARKNYAVPEKVGVEIAMQTQTFTISPSNETVAANGDKPCTNPL